MRVLHISALLLACSLGALALASAQAESDEKRGPAARIERLCSDQGNSGKFTEMQAKRAERLSERLKLTDAQKAAFKELEDIRAKSRADTKTAICANKPDLSTFANRLNFRETLLQRRLDNLKAENPKLIAFYNSLDDSQKAKFEELLRRGREGWRDGRGHDREDSEQERHRHHRHDDGDDN
jgi:Spy/CpxP family protein refolding chaperone